MFMPGTGSVGRCSQELAATVDYGSVRKQRTQKNFIFWDKTPYSPVRVNRLFGGIYGLHLRGGKTSKERNQHEEEHVLIVSWFASVGGGDRFLLNVGCLSPEYTALYSKR
jgi:hypothetical protein